MNRDNNIEPISEPLNKPEQTGVIKTFTEGKNSIIPFYGNSDYGLTTAGLGNFRSCATFTSHLSSVVFATVSEYVPPGGSESDKIKLFVSYNRGVDWVLRSTFDGFDPAVDCRKNEMDLEVIISGSDTIAFVAAGYDYGGHALSGMLRINVATGANTFSVWQFGGWNGASVNTYNPRVTSNNTKYGSNAYVFMTVSSDSQVVSGYKATQRFAILTTPYSNNLLNYRVPNTASGGFYWSHTTPERPYVWQDICFIDSSGIDIIFTAYNNTNNLNNFILTAKSYDYGNTSAASPLLFLNDTVSQVRVASCGGANNQTILVGFRVKDSPLNNYDFSVFLTTNSGINWTNQFVENSTDTCIFIDVQSVKLTSNRYKLAYTTWGKKDYYRGLMYIVGSGFIFTPAYQVNNQQADINFFGVKAGYANSIGGDSCLALWARDTVLGSSNLYASYLCQTTVGIQGSNETPGTFSLHQNYPNPFNPSTTIKFDMPKDGNVRITVFDMLGKEVQFLADEFKEAGSYEINFDASSLSSGTYFYKLTAGSFTEIKKMVLIK